VIGADKIKKAQENCSEPKADLKYHCYLVHDVIHGHKTTFPIPLGCRAVGTIPLIEKKRRFARLGSHRNGLCWAFSQWLTLPETRAGGGLQKVAGEDAYLGSLVRKSICSRLPG
jgi:beta-glucosidase